MMNKPTRYVAVLEHPQGYVGIVYHYNDLASLGYSRSDQRDFTSLVYPTRGRALGAAARWRREHERDDA